MITFYTLDGTTKKNNEAPYSRIEDLPAVPLCLEYVKHKLIGSEAKKNSDEKKPLETLLWGDDLGIITKYDFTESNWHICQYKDYGRPDRQYLSCCKGIIKDSFERRNWNHASLTETKALNEELTASILEDSNQPQQRRSKVSTVVKVPMPPVKPPKRGKNQT